MVGAVRVHAPGLMDSLDQGNSQSNAAAPLSARGPLDYAGRTQKTEGEVYVR